jgi:predicted enzyme related to lactoylglutathione lyase
MFFSGDDPVAGCMPAADDPAGQDGEPAGADAWSVYLATDDVEKTVATAGAEGGSVALPPMPVGDVGTMAYVVDPSGAVVGAWQPGTFFGFPTYAETGKPAWWELHTRDYAAVLPFYRSVFGWETQSMGDTDEFRYSVLQVGDLQAAGVMDASSFLEPGESSHWSVYIAVDDADAVQTRATELGGSVVSAAQDTPYGRLAEVADPTGARIRLLGPNREQAA